MTAGIRALGVAALAIVACAGPDTAPDASLPPSATWVLHTANEQGAPALVADRIWADDGSHVQLFVTADTLEVSSAGRYLQRAYLLGYTNGVLSSRVTYADHGVVTRDGATLHFVSNYLGNVAFDATMTDAATLTTTQDLALEGTPARYVLRAR